METGRRKEAAAEVEGRAGRPGDAHGVLFRMEIDSMRRTIMAHVNDHEGTINYHIEQAISECMSRLEVEISATVNQEIDIQIAQMVRSRVHDVVWNEGFGESLKQIIREKLKAEFSD